MQIKDLGTEKTIPDNSDLIPIQQLDGTTRHITKVNLLGDTALQILPNSFTHFHDGSKLLSGGEISIKLGAFYHGMVCFQTPAVVNNSFSFNKLLEAGNYTMAILYQKGNNRGDLKLEINNVLSFNDLIGYQNGYSIAKTTRSIIVPTSGMISFKWTVYQKQAASTGYGFGMTKISGFKL